MKNLISVSLHSLYSFKFSHLARSACTSVSANAELVTHTHTSPHPLNSWTDVLALSESSKLSNRMQHTSNVACFGLAHAWKRHLNEIRRGKWMTKWMTIGTKCITLIGNDIVRSHIYDFYLNRKWCRCHGIAIIQFSCSNIRKQSAKNRNVCYFCTSQRHTGAHLFSFFRKIIVSVDNRLLSWIMDYVEIFKTSIVRHPIDRIDRFCHCFNWILRFSQQSRPMSRRLTSSARIDHYVVLNVFFLGYQMSLCDI